jgi:hypothetical protein
MGKRGAFVIAALFAPGVAGGCASTVRREVATSRGSAPTAFDLTPEHAALADQYERDAPNDPEAACRYWKQIEPGIPSANGVRSCMQCGSSPCGDLVDWCRAKQASTCPGAASASCSAPLTKPARRYMGAEAIALPAGNDPGPSAVSYAGPDARDYADGWSFLNPPNDAVRLPKNSSVEVVRYLRNLRDEDHMRRPGGAPGPRWGGARGPGPNECSFALVRIVDAGGEAEAGRLYRMPRQVLSEQTAGTSPADQVKQREEKQAEAARRMAEAEVTSGKCSDAHVDYLRQGLGVLSSYLGASSSEVLELGAHAFAVATDTSTPLTLTTGLGGEEHPFAVAFEPFAGGYLPPAPSATVFEVLDEQGYPVKTESRLMTIVSSAFNLPTSGYVLQANANATLKMSLKGHGCVLLFVVRRY